MNAALELLDTLKDALDTLYTSQPRLQEHSVPINEIALTTRPGEAEWTFVIATPVAVSTREVRLFSGLKGAPVPEVMFGLLELLRHLAAVAPEHFAEAEKHTAMLHSFMLAMAPPRREFPEVVTPELATELEDQLMNMSLAGFDAAQLRELAARALVKAETLESVGDVEVDS